MKRWAWLLCALLLAPLAAHAAFFLTGMGKMQMISNEVDYRIEAGVPASLQAVMADQRGWTSNQQAPFAGTVASTRVWARFNLPDLGERRKVLISTPPWETVEYYVVRNGRVVSQQRTGLLVPYSKDGSDVSMTPRITHSGFARVSLEPGQATTIYALLQNDNRFETRKSLKFRLWDAEQVRQGERSDRMFQGLFFGVLLVLVLYNLAMFIIDRKELSYLYYVLVQLGNSIVFGSAFGLTSEYVWTEHPQWDYGAFFWAAAFCCWGGIQFVRYYLNTMLHFPKSDKLLKHLLAIPCLLFAAVVLTLAFSHFDGNLIMLAMILVTFASIIPMVGVTIYAAFLGNQAARLLLVVVAIAGASSFISGLSVLGLVSATDLSLQLVQAGNALSGIILSMGLGLRVRELRAQFADQLLQEARRQSQHEQEKRALVEAQSQALEHKVQERTAQLARAQQESEALLSNILPSAIIEELRANGHSEPRRYEEASILFTDFAGFTAAVSTMPAKRMVQELDDIFRRFDEIIAEHGLEKIKTIGDAYMAACGVPVARADHAERCVRAALALNRYITQRNQGAAMKWGLRVGVHSGAVVAGIVGKYKYAYDVWGDTVNIASRLESAGEVNRVNVSAYTFELVQANFKGEYRGKLPAKGKGDIDMYFVLDPA